MRPATGSIAINAALITPKHRSSPAPARSSSSGSTLAKVRIGIVGVSGYGGSELLRLCIGHPSFEVVYASGESTVGQTLAQRFPALAGHATGKIVIQPFVPEKIDGIDL